MARRAFLGCLLAGALLGSGLLADEVLVKTKDGASYQGEYVEHGDTVSVSAKGVETVMPKSDVASVEHLAGYDQEFKNRLAKLDAKDVNGRIALAREALDRRQYELAREALESAQLIDSNNPQVNDLMDLVQGQIRLDRLKQEQPSPAAPAAPLPRAAPSGQAAISKRLLTPADVEAIRRCELKPIDLGVRIRFDADVKKRFADSQNVAYSDFAELPPAEQAIDIYNNGDDTMREKVQVLSDPQSMLQYRRQIQPLVIQNCAAASCHGGPSGGDLILLTGPENDLLTYTNFYILQSYEKKTTSATGVFSSGKQQLVDRGHGDKSLLANYGLPADIGEYDHPQVNGKAITPIFRNKLDPRYQIVVEWMNNSLIEPQPDYGIRYTPPTAQMPIETTQPSRRQEP